MIPEEVVERRESRGSVGRVVWRSRSAPRVASAMGGRNAARVVIASRRGSVSAPVDDCSQQSDRPSASVTGHRFRRSGWSATLAGAQFDYCGQSQVHGRQGESTHRDVRASLRIGAARGPAERAQPRNRVGSFRVFLSSSVSYPPRPLRLQEDAPPPARFDRPRGRTARRSDGGRPRRRANDHGLPAATGRGCRHGRCSARRLPRQARR